MRWYAKEAAALFEAIDRYREQGPEALEAFTVRCSSAWMPSWTMTRLRKG